MNRKVLQRLISRCDLYNKLLYSSGKLLRYRYPVSGIKEVLQYYMYDPQLTKKGRSQCDQRARLTQSLAHVSERSLARLTLTRATRLPLGQVNLFCMVPILTCSSAKS